MDPNVGWHTMAQKLVVVDYLMTVQRGVCCLCEDAELKMDPYRRQHDKNPLAATLEHLIPKRDGGPNTVGNVKLAHKMCNQALGSLWEENRLRERDGIPLLEIDHALAAARRRFAAEVAARLNGEPIPLRDNPVHASRLAHALSQRPAPPGYLAEPSKKRQPAPMTLAAVLASGKPIGLERGQTLPGWQPSPDPIPVRARPAPRPKDLHERKTVDKVRRPICSACGSARITRDASLRWDLKSGWVIAEHREGYDCQDCEADAAPRWDFVNPGVDMTPS